MKNLLEQICYGYDGLIRTVCIKYFASEPNAEVEISVQKNGQWVNIKFIISSIYEYKMEQVRDTTNIVISDGIFFGEFNGIKYIDFSPYADIKSFNNVEDVRRSSMFFGAKNIHYKIAPYSEK